MAGTMFDMRIGAIGGAGAGASLGGSQPAAPAAATAPGAQRSTVGSGSPFLPTHPAGVVLWVGVGAVVLYIALWYSLPA